MTFLLTLLGAIVLVIALARAVAAPDGPRCHHNPKPPGVRKPDEPPPPPLWQPMQRGR